ncbi:hypothetical protein [uncultured Brevundimonas sp.]|uniref:hypothetical protein n=1 Tax=uncultured Brevundimonas sp. TaxID=213418 RepID=UPI0025CC7A68|nr:hypothetical protein [uncultured Brevundimonas sp.]
MIASLLLALGFELAPQPPVWNSIENERAHVATLRYDPSITISVGCQSHNLFVAISRLPAAGADYRRLDIGLSNDVATKSTWVVPQNDRSVAFSTAPHVYARRLRISRPLLIIVPQHGADEEQRYELEMPKDAGPLEAVMTACGVPFEDASDLTYDPTVSVVTWERPPRIVPPTSALRSSRVDITVECGVDVSGAPKDCVIVDERPARSGMGRAALESIRSGKIRQIDGVPFEPGTRFRVDWNIRLEE